MEDSFPCRQEEFEKKSRHSLPTSVDRLSPGDIDIIAALGDGNVAANGALSKDFIGLGVAFRGVSFATGGDEDWRSVLTLANILKEFNPKLKGQSTGHSDAPPHGGGGGGEGLNVAQKDAVSQDLVDQVDRLIFKLKAYDSADLSQKWKVLLRMYDQSSRDSFRPFITSLENCS